MPEKKLCRSCIPNHIAPITEFMIYRDGKFLETASCRKYLEEQQRLFHRRFNAKHREQRRRGLR